MFGYLVLISIDFDDFSSLFTPLVSFCFDSKIYQTLETVFHRQSEHHEFRQKYSAARRIFNSLFGVWISRWNCVSCVWYITSCQQSGSQLSIYTLHDWLKKFAPLFYPIRNKTKPNGDSPRFPALCVSYMWLLRVLIGSLYWLCSLWLARVITLVLVLRHSIENQSKAA